MSKAERSAFTAPRIEGLPDGVVRTALVAVFDDGSVYVGGHNYEDPKSGDGSVIDTLIEGIDIMETGEHLPTLATSVAHEA